MVRKHIGVFLGICLSLTFLSVSSVSNAAPEVVGTKCVKAGSFRTAKNVKYQCKKSAQGLRWVINSPKNTPTTATTTTTTTTSTTTTTIPLTCALGGACVVGDKGPGGGKVFYEHSDGGFFTSADSVCKSSCRYLEAAPVLWSTEEQTPSQASCKYPAKTKLNPHTEPTCIWSTNTTGEIGPTAQGRGIGTGSTNTTAIISDSNAPDTAAAVARGYRGGGKTDWHLASFDEMTEFAESKLFDTEGRKNCWPWNHKDCVNVFHFLYWTSTENPLKPSLPYLKSWCAGDIASLLRIDARMAGPCGLDGSNNAGFFKGNGTSVRPIRAFGPLGASSKTTDTTTSTTAPLYTDPEITSVSKLLTPQECRIQDATVNQYSEVSSGFPRPEALRNATGQLEVLVVPVNFADLSFSNTLDSRGIEKALSGVSRFYSAMSYGRATVNFTIAPQNAWVDLGGTVAQNGIDRNSAGPKWDGSSFYRKVIEIFARSNSIVGYDVVIIVTGDTRAEKNGGQAYSKKTTNQNFAGVQLFGKTPLDLFLVAHELGHAWLGFEDLYLFDGGSPFRNWDTMSTGTVELSGWNRFLAGWLEPNAIRCVSRKTLTRSFIAPLDNQENSSPSRLIVVPLSGFSAVAVDFRVQSDWNPELRKPSVVLYKVDTIFDHGKGPIRLLGVIEKSGESITIDGIKISVINLNSSGAIIEVRE